MPAGMGSQGSAGQGSSSKVSRGGGNRYSKSKKKSRLGSQSKKSLTEMMEDEKNVLLAEKHGELQDVWNKHDMLVREIFHMESYTLMTSFDPADAKQDERTVFRDYKANYDLVNRAVPGPSRTTRRSQTERRQTITTPSYNLPSFPAASQPKPKIKTNTAVWESLAAARKKSREERENAKEKRREAEMEMEQSKEGKKETGRTKVREEKVEEQERGYEEERQYEQHEQEQEKEEKDKEQEQEKEQDAQQEVAAEKVEAEAAALPQDSQRPADGDSILLVGNEEIQGAAEEPLPTILVRTNGNQNMKENRAAGVSEKRKRKASMTNGHIGESISVISRRSNLPKEPARRVTRHSSLASISFIIDISAPPPLKQKKIQHSPIPPPSPKVKRIKLLVRRPPPPITNPCQRPPLPKHNSSLREFLSSYVAFNDQDVDNNTLQRYAAADAAVFERTESFRKAGRFIPGTDMLFGFNVDTQSSFTTPQRLAKDQWDDVIEAVTRRHEAKNKIQSGRQITSQIASKIQAYWEAQEARKDKIRLQEERRLRTLAKATIKMVTNEWKKAVFHIREQERLKLEAEEVKRGHAHLDAILDQSGQILETQQGDLSRGDLPHSRSRSSSVSGDWSSEEEEEEEEEEEGADEGQDRDLQGYLGSDSILGDLEDDDAGTTTDMLLDDNIVQIPARTPSSIALDATASVRNRTPSDDENDDADGSSVFAVNQLVLNGESDSSPLRPRPLAMHLSSLVPLDYGDSEPSSARAATSHGGSPMPDSPFHLSSGQIEPEPAYEESEYLFERSFQPSPSVPALDPLDHDMADLEVLSAPMVVDKSRPETSFNTSVDGDEPLQSVSDHSHTQSPSFPALDSIDDRMDGISAQNSVEVLASPSRTPSSSGPDMGIASASQIEEAHTSPLLEDQPLIDGVAAEGSENSDEGLDQEQEVQHEPELNEADLLIPEYLKPYAVAPVEWDADQKVTPPLLLRGILRPYQQSGLEWLASLHMNNLNGILADEMGLGKTIQTIALLAHLACDRGIWGPHLIVVPTSVLLNWEMEFKKFLPGFKILSYHGSTKRRKELRQGWNDRHHFNVCITSYTLASRDAHIFKRRAWYYMILDEAHMIKNFKSQRWNILLMFRSFRRLLLTGTPLQNNLTELWALLQFLMSGANFANLKEFGDWFSNPLEKAIEMGNIMDDETMQRVSKLHTVLRPYLLRRMKRDVEKELPSKYEHLVLCPLSKRQRFLYDEFMSRAHTRDALQSGVYQKIANILMQLRKVCNHPDLFEVRPIVTSFAMEKSAITDFEIKELLVRRRFLEVEEERVNLDLLGLRFIDHQNTSSLCARETRCLDATSFLPFITELPEEPPPKDTRTTAGFRKYSAYLQRASAIARWSHVGYLNRLRCNSHPIYATETLDTVTQFYKPILPFSAINIRSQYWDTVQPVNHAVKSFVTRAQDMASYIDRFAFVTPPVVALDLPRIAFSGREVSLIEQSLDFDEVLHKSSVKLQIAFPDPSLLQFDCGKLQELTRLLREKKAGGHRVLIFTQMTKILDILEIYLNFHGYLYLRLDGATKIEDRQYITERFNADQRVFCFIASSRSGGVGINLTGADTVIFYDSDFNPQMDRQCEDRAHRIGQIRDVHIYRFVSQHTVEEAMLRKANQKRSLDDIVIQKGEFDWRTLFNDEGALSKALGEFEDTEDAHAAAVAAREEIVMEGADEADFGGDADGGNITGEPASLQRVRSPPPPSDNIPNEEPEEEPEEPEDGGSVVEYMIKMVQRDYGYFREWRL
ncbi:hypothetical protein L208DRAFT_1422693 [Tricholoma matsutake]|nr:hypothetical protein L208DRAFT_1422693 [Tricholoma matsutake 945]